MEPFALILAAMLAQTQADAAPPPPPPGMAAPSPFRARGGDADGDGVITRQEWMARFDRLDTDHDGKLTAAERRADRPMRPRRPAGDRPEGGRDRAMPDMTREQYLARAAQRFDQMDANHDGTIDAAEMATGHPRWRRGGGMPDASSQDR